MVFGERHLRHLLRSYMHYYNGARTEERCANPTSRSGHRTHSADTNSWRVTPSICSDLISDRDSRPIDRSSHNSSWLFGRLLRRKNHTKAGCLHDRRALDAGADSRAVKPRWRHDKQAHQFPAADRAKFRQAVSDRISFAELREIISSWSFCATDAQRCSIVPEDHCQSYPLKRTLHCV